MASSASSSLPAARRGADGDGRREPITAFPALPEELIKLIFEYACQIPARTASPIVTAATAGQQSSFDVKTTMTLMLVSRAAYSLVVPLLYRSVTIARPSQLVEFVNTVVNRPSLGLLVRNLWVGSLDSPSLNYLPLIVSNVSTVEAAKAHITRYEQAHGGAKRVHHPTPSDSVYIEAGVDFAAMSVPPYPDRLVQLQPSMSSAAGADEYLRTSTSNRRQSLDGVATDAHEWDGQSTSSQSTSATGAYGVDRLSLGYDAAGDWIGMDDWMLRCLEVQYAIEFHWEWVGLTSPATHNEEDEAALRNDPMDWADATEPVSALPSRQREYSTDTMASSSTSGYLRSNASRIGFAHLQQFFTLRKAGHSPRNAANILLLRYLRSVHTHTSMPPLADVCNIDMLADEREPDHFLHPALFARSGAIHLIVPAEAPEGIHAPPHAIPAPAAAMTVFHDAPSSADDDSSEEEQELANVRSSAAAAAALEGRQYTSDDVLDFVDLFGHIPISSRTLYSGHGGEVQPESESETELSQTLRPSPVERRRKFGTHTQLRYTRHRPTTRWLRPPPTLGSLLANLRSVLATCPRIRVLGLNGFLERVVGGSRECAGLGELRHLSVGPPPPFWSSALNLHQRTLHSLRSLHISGCMLFRSEAMALGGFTAALPHLREVDWTLWLGHVLEHPINVVDALTYLLGKEGGGGGTSAVHGNGGGTTAGLNQTSRRLERVQRRKPLRAVRATLNSEDVEFWQRHANEALANDARLQLRACTSKDTDVNLRAVRQWWEAKAGLL